MIEFLQTYWFELVLLIVSIGSLVASFIRRKTKGSSESIKNMISELLPGFINLAEASGVSGQNKLLFVVNSIMARLKSYVSSKDEQYWITYIRQNVENILSTPQKKGVQDEKN